MTLPKEDVKFLEALDLPWRIESDKDQGDFLIIENFEVKGGGFAPEATTLMIRIPALYNTTPLDMWHCDPPIRRGGQFPAQADVMQNYLGRIWQMFSRHIPPGGWLPGRDGLRSFFPFIFRELQGKG